MKNITKGIAMALLMVLAVSNLSWAASKVKKHKKSPSPAAATPLKLN